jgi:hypothetical protein
MAKKKCKSAHAVDKVEATKETLTSRAGINLFVRYLHTIQILPLFSHFFRTARKNSKGASIVELFTQLLCWHFEGTNRHLSSFDTLAKDPGYAASIETDSKRMVSSHAVKRFFNSIPLGFSTLFRMLLMRLFVWRLNINKPELIILNVDAMVMDNDDAPKRDGANPTYKKVLGFAPLQMTWGRFIIDAIFRSGEKHSNHGNDTAKMIRRAVKQIRAKYCQDVPIIIRMDSGYCDQKLFAELELLQIGYIIGGRFFPDVKSYLGSLPRNAFDRHYGKTEEDIWEYCEFGDRRSTWKRFRRAIFWRPFLEEKRFLLPGFRPGTMIYTNLGMGQAIDEQLEKVGYEYLTKAEEIISSYHQRGADELVHRCLKDFGFEQLPFKNFAPNAAMYYSMLLGFFLYETFKEDVSNPVVPISATPTTLRRKLIDIAGKIVRTGRQVILKVADVAMDALNFKELWERCSRAPRLLRI